MRLLEATGGVRLLEATGGMRLQEATGGVLLLEATGSGGCKSHKIFLKCYLRRDEERTLRR